VQFVVRFVILLIPYAIVALAASSPLCTCTVDSVGGAVIEACSVHLFY